MNSFGSLGSKTALSASLLLGEYMNYIPLVISGAIFHIFYLAFSKTKYEN